MVSRNRRTHAFCRAQWSRGTNFPVRKILAQLSVQNIPTEPQMVSNSPYIDAYKNRHRNTNTPKKTHKYTCTQKHMETYTYTQHKKAHSQTYSGIHKQMHTDTEIQIYRNRYRLMQGIRICGRGRSVRKEIVTGQRGHQGRSPPGPGPRASRKQLSSPSLEDLILLHLVCEPDANRIILSWLFSLCLYQKGKSKHC